MSVAARAATRKLTELNATAAVSQARKADNAALEADWRAWLETMFPRHVAAGFAVHHEEYWEWLWAMEPDSSPLAFIGVWPRGGGKSTVAELGATALGVRGKRRYIIYVRDTQDRADDSVSNIGKLLESNTVEEWYPEHSERSAGKYGRSDGWRRERLRTNGGFTVDALGLDTATRGVKLEDTRPDGIIFDDVDGRHDSPAATEKKIATITASLLPAGTDNAAVLGIQNLVIPDGVFSQLADGRADFLSDRIVSGPHPAVENLEVEKGAWPGEPEKPRYVITGGRATWAGQDLDACQRLLDRMGLSAFLSECQHEVDAPPGGMFDHLEYRRCDFSAVPWGDLVRVVVWVDPAVTNTDQSDAHGIQADGRAEDDTIYRLYSYEGKTTPVGALKRALLKATELGAEAVGVETDQGGDTWRSAYDEAWRGLVDDPAVPGVRWYTEKPLFRSEKAGAGHGPKAHRASQMLADYEKGRFVHVRGTHQTLEQALNRFPKTKPFDLVDAAYWSFLDVGRASFGPDSKALAAASSAPDFGPEPYVELEWEEPVASW